MSLTDVNFPSNKTIVEIIYLLKKTGGFNNDWDTAYTILMLMLSKLPDTFQKEFIYLTNSNEFLKEKKLHKRFEYTVRSLKSRPKHFSINLKTLSLEMKKFIEGMDHSGINFVRRSFRNSNFKEIFFATRRFLNYPRTSEESLLVIVFDEMFYGPELFKAIYKRNCQFYSGKGFVEIEKEKIIVSISMLEELAQTIGRENFGIVSGRDRLSARFSLGEILDKFRTAAVLFLMDYNYQKKKSEKVGKNFKKPNPQPLFEASKGLNSFKYALYVGDSAEDMLMVKRANAIEKKFISVGVYSLSDFKQELRSYFFDADIDLILNSIIELPSVLMKIKRGEIRE